MGEKEKATLAFPIRMERTDAGWWVAEFHFHLSQVHDGINPANWNLSGLPLG